MHTKPMTDDLTVQRQQLIASLRTSGIRDERLLEAIATIPRELFLTSQQRSMAYSDSALPIDMGQTISQPFMVAIMTQTLQLKGQERILEIGTGSGYQTAILARLAAHVHSIERYQQLSFQAAQRLQQLDLHNISLYVGDGTLGWPDAQPYDRILVTAGAPEIPLHLLGQLVTWGMLVVPVGRQDRQELLVVHRAPWGPEVRSLGGCVFVPLVGEKGWHLQQ
jgi:protein-L-isoaspartate(D-aspartate) O-methyltransferase